MKISRVVLILLAVGILSGCEDQNSPVVGAASTDEAGSNKAAPASTEPVCPPCRGLIVLDEDVVIGTLSDDASETIRFASVSGEVKFAMNVSPILVGDFVTLQLNLEAEMVPADGAGPTCLFSGTSEENIHVSRLTRPTLLVKRYDAHNIDGPQRTSLFVSFVISEEGVSVERLWISRTVGLNEVF